MRIIVDLNAVTNQINVDFGLAEPHLPIYQGPYEVTPSRETQILPTADRHTLRDIIVNPGGEYDIIQYIDGDTSALAIRDAGGEGVKLATKTVTENGTYSASDDDVDGFSEVTVEVSGGSTATEITYDNSGSGLVAENVQDAIDELADNKSSVSVSATGTATDEVQYITIDGVEKKLTGGLSLERQSFNIEWDGDITGRDLADWDGTPLVKVSDRIFTKEELLGAYVMVHVNGYAPVSSEITEIDFYDDTWDESLNFVEPTFPLAYTVFVASGTAGVHTDWLLGDVTLPSDGTYFYYEYEGNEFPEGTTALQKQKARLMQSGEDVTKEVAKNLCTHNAGSHNGIYRGKDLTNVYTIAELSDMVSRGTFDDIFIGDYIRRNIVIDRVGRQIKWYFAGFDTFLRNGDTETTAHHAVMIPDTVLYNSNMNNTNTTTGAFVGSRMFTEELAKINTALQNAFGSAHVLQHRELLSSAITSTAPSMAGAGLNGAAIEVDWEDIKANLMNECMVYGVTSVSSSLCDIADRHEQLPLFRLAPEKICPRVSWWLSAVASSTLFASVNGYGFADANAASDVLGVRPYFLFV